MTWQPIETAPKTWAVIIAVPNPQHSSGYMVGEAQWWDSDGWWWAGTGPGDYHADQVWGATHWQPLPEPPAAERDLTKEASNG